VVMEACLTASCRQGIEPLTQGFSVRNNSLLSKEILTRRAF
jgi:hypothetical protein